MNNIEPKKQKKINRDTYWMYKLLDFCWGKSHVPLFRGYCPLFHATWITIVLLPLVLVGKIFEFVGGIFWDLIKNSSVSETKSEPQKTNIIKPADHFIERVFEEILKRPDENESDIVWEIYYDSIMLQPEREWFLNTPNWKSFYPAIKERIIKAKKDEEKAKIRKAALKVKIDTIISYTSWMVKPFFVISGIAAGIVLYKIMFFIVGKLAGLFTLNLLWTYAQAAGILFAAVLLIAFIAKIFQLIRAKLNSIPDSPKVQEIQQSSLFTKIISGLGNFISEGYGFLRDTIKMLYKKECPMIVYQEKNGPIEKNISSESAPKSAE